MTASLVVDAVAQLEGLDQPQGHRSTRRIALSAIRQNPARQAWACWRAVSNTTMPCAPRKPPRASPQPLFYDNNAVTLLARGESTDCFGDRRSG